MGKRREREGAWSAGGDGRIGSRLRGCGRDRLAHRRRCIGGGGCRARAGAYRTRAEAEGTGRRGGRGGWRGDDGDRGRDWHDEQRRLRSRKRTRREARSEEAEPGQSAAGRCADAAVVAHGAVPRVCLDSPSGPRHKETPYLRKGKACKEKGADPKVRPLINQLAQRPGAGAASSPSAPGARVASATARRLSASFAASASAATRW